MSDLAALLARIEAAEGPDREIDALIAIATKDLPEWMLRPSLTERLAARPDGHVYFFPNGAGDRSKEYTASLDAAVALCERVLPGWGWLVRTGPLWACVWQPKGVGDASFEVSGRPPALALCAAVVKAEIERRGEKP